MVSATGAIKAKKTLTKSVGRRRESPLVSQQHNVVKFSSLEEKFAFTDKLVLSEENWPFVVMSDVHETLYADGTRCVFSYGVKTFILANGVKRIYRNDALVFEELPDGRMRAYQAGSLVYERDGDGNYQAFKFVGDRLLLCEEGSSLGWSKKYVYKARFSKNTQKESLVKKVRTPKSEPSNEVSFTDELVLVEDDLPFVVFYNDFETLYADGTRCIVSPEKKVFIFNNGTKRTYSDNQLVSEELPDGRMRAYVGGALTYERDAEGGYKAYKMFEDKTLVCEEGEANLGWSKKYNYKTEYDEETWEKRFVAQELFPNGVEVCKVFNDRHILVEKKQNDAYQKFYPNGKLKEQKTADNKLCRFAENGNLLFEKLPDGSEHQWTVNGSLIDERLPDGTHRHWSNKGTLTLEKLPDGSKRKWTDSGVLTLEKSPDGTEHQWDDSGVMILESLPNGVERQWASNGVLIFEQQTNGVRQRWAENGVLIDELLADETRHQWSEDGVMTFEKLPNGLKRQWNDGGVKIAEELPDGTAHQWTDNGVMIYEKLPNGLIRKWYGNGSQLSFEQLPNGNYKYFDVLNRVVKEGNEEQQICTEYRYYGDTKKVLDKTVNKGGVITYKHFNTAGKDDTKHYLAIKEMAKERTEKENALSRKKGKRVILSKRSKFAKAIAYNLMLKKLYKKSMRKSV